jgi:hypothetical protein
MKNSKEKDDLILDAIHILIDSRASIDIPEPYRTIILRTFKKFRSANEINKILNKAKYYKNTL